jgi:leucyl aminopeptidase (aminopeptidase T)
LQLSFKVLAAALFFAGVIFLGAGGNACRNLPAFQPPLAFAQQGEASSPAPEKGTVAYGAMQAVRNCARVKPGEKVIMITDRDTQGIAGEILKQLEMVSPGNTRVFLMEDFGSRPDDGSAPLPFPAPIAQAMQDESVKVSFYVATTKKGELQSFRQKMLDLAENKKIRHAHMVNVTEEIMKQGMSADYNKIQEISKKVYDAVNGAKKIRVTTPTGTDFTVELNPRWKWAICDGIITPDKFSNLPGGEVYTCAWRVEKGIVVVDGVLGDYFAGKYGPIHQTPVTLRFKDSRVTEIECSNRELLKDLQEYVKMDENADRFSEFAIGTNIGLDELIGVLLQDEKFPGVHIAIGDGYPDHTGCDWVSEAHLDCVLRNPTVVVDGKTTIMKDGKFILP